MVQKLRIHLPKQETRVWSLLWEDPTATDAQAPQREEPLQWGARAVQPGGPRSLQPGEAPLQWLIPACASFSPAFLTMYSAYKLNKQGDNM